MASHLKRALGMDDEQPEPSTLSIDDYLGGTNDDIDNSTANPVSDNQFASNTELPDTDPGENPHDASIPEETNLTEPEVSPDLGSDLPSPDEEEPKGLFKDDEPVTDNLRQALTRKFLENAKERFMNSDKFQDRAAMLNAHDSEDDDAIE
jgi:hypothetical protein